MGRLRVLLGVAWCLPVAAVSAQAPDFTAARRVIDSLMRAHQLPSVSVAVARDGEVLWEEGFGMANVEKQVRATPHTAYSLASISKPFTATGLMRLVERGAVRLDRPLNDYLGAARVRAYEGRAAAATVQHVLTHTAGLPLHYQFFYADKGYAPPATDETIRRFGILVYRPGSGYQYSNLGYGLLDYVLRRQSRLSYGEYMRREVFEPLGMTHTSVGPRPGLEAETAERYGADNRPIPYYTFDHPGASEVYASAHDLVRFGMFHLGDSVPGQRPVLSLATRRAMQRDVAVEGAGLTRGLGWGIRADEYGWRRVAHTGGMPGVSTVLALYPAGRVAVVVLTNKAVPGAMSRIAQELAAAVLPGYEPRLRAALASVQGTPVVADWTSLQGRWRGYVRSSADSFAVSLTVDSAGPRDVQVGKVREARPAQRGWGGGVFSMTTPTPFAGGDLARQPATLAFTLRSRGDTLSGYAAAMAGPPGADRAYYALSSFARLVRERPPQPTTLPARR